MRQRPPPAVEAALPLGAARELLRRREVLAKASLPEAWAVLRSTYWFVPSLLTAASVALCAGLIYLDHVAPLQPSGVETFFFPTSVEGARALLSAIVSSMMTVVALTFSVTVVALTVSAQHYGPRLLNSFMGDRTVQVVLGLLIGTFAYSVLVLGSLGAEGTMPLHWATVGALILVAISVVALIAFVHHVTSALQVSSVASGITTDFEEAVDLDYPEASESHPAEVRLDEEGREWGDVRSDGHGYVQRIDEGALVRLAEEAGAVICIVRPPGKFVVEGAVIGRACPATAVTPTFARAFNGTVVLGRDRTSRHDIEFPVKQLVEIALRALSPGVNEPFTAISCIDRLGQCLAELTPRAVKVPEVQGRDGEVRLIIPRQTFPDLLRVAFDPIRIFGGQNPAVYARLLDTIGMLSEVATRGEDREALRTQAQLVVEAARGAIHGPDDIAFVEAHHRRALQALGTGGPVERAADAILPSSPVQRTSDGAVGN